MAILAIETSTRVLIVTVVKLETGESMYAQEEVSLHSENVLKLVQQVLDKSEKKLTDLKAIACGLGPGSFTGLRIGLATAKGLCLGLKIPLIGIPSLELLRSSAMTEQQDSFVIRAAHHGYVYAQLFSAGVERGNATLEQLVQPMLLNNDQLNGVLSMLDDNVKLLVDFVPSQVNLLRAHVISPAQISEALAFFSLQSYNEKKFLSVETATPTYAELSAAEKNSPFQQKVPS